MLVGRAILIAAGLPELICPLADTDFPDLIALAPPSFGHSVMAA